ncbi:MAG: helix-turn-helix transcriptional regulator [Nitrospirae bacterium]|nr:helix-turn-helix transcriptional regulator [Nitrospirota bacterium]
MEARRPKPQHDPAYRELCRHLRDSRATAALTQRGLAKRLKRLPSTIAKIETGARRIDLVEVILWCRATGADPVEAIRRVERALGSRIS